MEQIKKKEEIKRSTIMDEEKFIRGLGCWSYSNVSSGLARRTKDEYVHLLKKYIEVNGYRNDRIGVGGCAFAYKEMDRLGDTTSDR